MPRSLLSVCWRMPAFWICRRRCTLLASWWVIGASGVLFLVEFVADKIPAFDLLLECAPNLRSSPGRGPDCLWRDRPALAGKATAGDASRRSHCAGGPRRQNCGPSGCHPFSRTRFQHHAQHGRRCARDLSDSGLRPSIRCWRACLCLAFLIAIGVVIRWVVRALKNLFRGAEAEVESLAVRR